MITIAAAIAYRITKSTGDFPIGLLILCDLLLSCLIAITLIAIFSDPEP